MSVDIAALVETPNFRAAEDASWLKTTCDTGLVDGVPEHYDQVVAMSQGMINYTLKKMHEKNPELNVFDGENPLGTGLISAELKSPEILIDTVDRNVVTWRTNFDKGTLVFTAENGDKVAHPIDGWSIDVQVPLVMRDFKDKPDDTEEQRDDNKKQRDWIKKCFELPGDYTPARLYAKFSDARWSNVTFAGKSFTINGKPESYEAWKKRNFENARISLAFESTFKEICRAREIQGLTSIGVRFQLDDANKIPDDRAATYPPVTMNHQGYPYRMPSSSGAPEDWAQGLTQYVDPGTRNCLLYCENTTVRTMQQRMLGINGNFATLGSAKNEESRVEGTFVLSHQLFFERFLLPALQGFVREGQVYPREPTFYYKDGYKNYTIGQPYWIGENPEKDPQKDSTNEIYKFKLIVDPKDSTKMCYQASVPNSRDTPIKYNERNNDYNKLWSDGTPYVTVRWETGGKKIWIEGSTLYQDHITTTNHQNVDPGSHWLVPAITWSHIYQHLTWKMDITCEAADGTINFHLNAADDMVKVESKPDPDQQGWHWEVAGTTEKIREHIQSRVTQQLDAFKETLRDGFDGQLRFHYPGYGQLTFGKSIFNERGDFIAAIKYADMPAPDPNNRIIIPSPNKQTPPPPDPSVQPIGGSTGGDSTGGAPRLAWTSNSPVVASPEEPKKATAEGESGTTADDTTDDTPPTPPVDRRVVFSIKGTNSTQKPQYFSQLKLNYSGNAKRKDTLLRAIKFILGGSGTDQDTVAFNVTTSDGVTKLNNPQLQPMKLSTHSATCTVILTPAEGNVIEVPVGGSITVTAKGVSGSKSSTNYYIDVNESWCNAAGELTPGAISGFRARVPFLLK